MTPDQTTTFIDLSHTLATNLVSLADDSGTADVAFVGHGVGVEPVDGGESTAHVQSKEELILQGLESCTLALSSLQCTFRLFDTRLILLEHQLVIPGSCERSWMAAVVANVLLNTRKPPRGIYFYIRENEEACWVLWSMILYLA